MDVSYFAAGTLCNLLLDWPDELTLNCGSQSDFLLSVVSFLWIVEHYSKKLVNEP